MSDPTPGYYAVIPANVRYADLPPAAKLLFGELTALTNQEGYAWATNAYFAKLYDVRNATVSDWIKALKDGGFIRVEIDPSKGNERRIWITQPLTVKRSRSYGKPQDPSYALPDDTNRNTPNTTNNIPANAGGVDLFGPIKDTPKKRRKSALSPDDKAAAAAIMASNVAALLAVYPKPSAVPHVAARIVSNKLRKYPFETLLAAVNAYAKEKAGTEMRFVKSPENYFRDDCFLIEPPTNLPVDGKRAPLAPVLTAAARRAASTGVPQ